MKSFITKALAFTAAACLSTGAQAATFESKDGVLMLNDSNFSQEQDKHSFMLTMFYAPWCGHCNVVAPEYIAAAQELAKDTENPRPLGVINGDNDDAAALMKELKVDHFPTFIWFKHQVRQDFNADMDRDSIVKFVREQSGLLASTSVKSTEISECSKVASTIKDDKFASVLFSSHTTKLFNFYQSMITAINERHSEDRLDKDYTIFHYAEANRDMGATDVRMPKFKYYHAAPECLAEFKDIGLLGDIDMKYNQGRILVTSPENKPEVIEDKDGLGLEALQLSRFLVRFTEPAFRRMDRFNHPEYLQPNFLNKENKQATFLISREPKKQVKAFAAMDEAAIKMKFAMKYAYYGNIKPTKRQIHSVKEVTEKLEAHMKAQQEELDALGKKRVTTGSMTQARKDLDKKIDAEQKALQKAQKDDDGGVKPTTEQKDIMELVEEETIFQQFLTSLHITEKELPLIMNFDPIAANTAPMFIKSELKMDDITVDQLVKMAKRFNGHWDKPVGKSEDLPKDNSKPHKTIVGINYMEYTDGDQEALINHNVDWEPFCKVLQPEWVKLAEALKDIKGLNIGTFNTEKNLVGFVDHKVYPSIVHYTKTNKRGRKIKFNNKKGKQVESFVKYLTKHSDVFKAYLVANPTFDAVAIAKEIKVEEPKAEEKKEEKKEEKAAEPAAEKKDAEAEVVDLDAAPEAPKAPEAKKEEEKKEDVKTDL